MILALAGVMAMAISCQRELLTPDTDVEDGNIELNLSIVVPDMAEVATKAVDPDGGGVQNITVFCFDSYGFFISTVTADVTPGPADAESGVSLSGTFKVTVPAHTLTVHLVGNQNLTYFAEGHYENMSEVEVMTSIQGSAGRMIYWARKPVSELTPNSTVVLLRNQAKMNISVDASKGFTLSGWAVVNTNAYGTVAPYNSETGLFEAPSVNNPFVTAPVDDTRITGYYDVTNEEVEYFFESENSEEQPVDVIVKGRQGGGSDLYYRISVVDEYGNYINLLRNHNYTVNIDGALSYGQPTFEAALTAPATNNVWISISDNVPSIYDDNYRLSVDETFVVIAGEEFDDPSDPNVKYLYYTLEKLGDKALSQPSVKWLDGNNVASNNFTHNFNTATGRGELIIDLTAMGDEQKREGTLLIKSGRLSRRIKVITVKKQKFEPAWITTNVYGGSVGENVTMMFTIPETCPQELFPLDVLISVNELDVRNEAGIALPIIRKGEPGYGADNGIGYKYVYTLNEHGVQRLYLETILKYVANDNITVTIEADHFESLSKTATIRANENRYILLHNLRHYSAVVPADEVLYYHLVPMKKGAIVEFPTHLGEDIVWNTDNTVKSFTPITPGDNDEFLLYSEYLDHDTRATLHFDFYPVAQSDWSTGGRVYGFKRNTNGTPGKGATYHMLTNASRSDEVVRIASNPAGQTSVTGTGVCTGAQYRSAVFELRNFRAFDFSASINGDSDGTVTIPYEPGISVNVAFDVTSFKSTIEGAADDDNVSVDPFGTKFKIYIDAPMLEIDETRNTFAATKFYKDTDGRFVYVVDADRDTERTFGSEAASVTDNATIDYIGKTVTVNQTGERKRLPFKTSEIVSAGTITISSQEDIVVFNKQTFTVMDQVITGTVKYGPDASNLTDVPAGEFLPFEMLPTFNRIGAVTVTSDGNYELRLRSEYIYYWDTSKIHIQYVHDNVVYEAEFTSLKELYGSPDIKLLKKATP